MKLYTEKEVGNLLDELYAFIYDLQKGKTPVKPQIPQGIEITEEEIRREAEAYEYTQSLGIAEDYANEDFIAGVNWLLSKLKGE